MLDQMGPPWFCCKDGPVVLPALVAGGQRGLLQGGPRYTWVGLRRSECVLRVVVVVQYIILIINVIDLGVFALSWLLQAIVYWTYVLNY